MWSCNRGPFIQLHVEAMKKVYCVLKAFVFPVEDQVLMLCSSLLWVSDIPQSSFILLLPFSFGSESSSSLCSNSVGGLTSFLNSLALGASFYNLHLKVIVTPTDNLDCRCSQTVVV